MSWGLVMRWRRQARRWRAAAEQLALDDFAKRCDRHARADVLDQCADSLQRSLDIQDRKRLRTEARKGAA